MESSKQKSNKAKEEMQNDQQKSNKLPEQKSNTSKKATATKAKKQQAISQLSNFATNKTCCVSQPALELELDQLKGMNIQ